MPKKLKSGVSSRTKSKSKGRGSKGKRGKSRRRGKMKKPMSPGPSPPPPPPPPPVEPPVPKLKPKGTCFAAITPGPGKYAATSLVGYFEHDPTKAREPAFTFASGGRSMKKPQEAIPGPIYNCNDVTRFGPVSQSGPVITGRQAGINTGHLTPGPGHYSPEKYDNPRYHNAPEARLLGRVIEDKSSKYTPGPGDYNVPSSIGDFHPTINSPPSARLMGRSWDKKKKMQFHYTPGPNQYDYDSNAFLRSGPSARILGREKQKKSVMRDSGPGPGTYFAEFHQGADSPAFSFGIKHAPCVIVPPESGSDNF